MSKKIIKRIYNVVIILLFLGAIGWCFSHFYHAAMWLTQMMHR